jgi:hypothetical protein
VAGHERRTVHRHRVVGGTAGDAGGRLSRYASASATAPRTASAASS